MKSIIKNALNAPPMEIIIADDVLSEERLNTLKEAFLSDKDTHIEDRITDLSIDIALEYFKKGFNEAFNMLGYKPLFDMEDTQ